MPEWGPDSDAEGDLGSGTDLPSAPGPTRAPEPEPPAPNADGGPEHDSGAPVETGDIVIDSALRDLDSVDPADLDGHVEAAEALQRTLQGRLANLGE